MLRTAFAPHEGQGARARVRSGLFPCLCFCRCLFLIFRPAEDAMLASLSQVSRRAGLDVQTRIAEVSQAASTRDSRALLLLRDPATADDSCTADAHRPAVDDVFRQACR